VRATRPMLLFQAIELKAVGHAIRYRVSPGHD
jgi:hypothetical protein